MRARGRLWSILSPAIALTLIPNFISAQSTVATQGRWTNVIQTSVNPVGAAALPDGKVLIWSAYDRYSFAQNAAAQTWTGLFDPATGLVTEQLVTNTAHDMFCPGTSFLPDGRLLVTGGDTAARTSIYNPGTASWTAGSTMNVPRGYQGQVTIDDGRAFVLGGSWSGGSLGKNGETWANNLWTYLANALASVTLGPDPGGPATADRHPWLFSIGAGKVVHVGPSVAMNLYELNAGGRTTSLGNRADDQFSQNGTALMYDIGKILKAGGAAAYDSATATAGCYIVNVNNGVSVTKTGSLKRARGMHNAVVLPNGEVLVIGGMPVPVPFSDTNSILVPEIWNPTTGTWRDVAPISVPRNYHSTALLLPDGRVFSGGGGLCGAGCGANHSDVQIYSPPYLFKSDGTDAVRPTIQTAPAVAYHGATMDVITNGGTQFVLIRYSAVTHSVNNDQRRIPLTGTLLSAGAYRLNIPDAGVLTPGNYMLFTLDAAGVPSLARTINVQPPVRPQISLTAPTSGQTFQAPANIAINAAVTDPSSTVLRVEFYAGQTKLGEDSSAPYNFTWTNATAGSYTVTATVIDSTGYTVSASAPISVAATPVNRPPVVSLTAPASGSTFLAPASIVIAATASDPDGNLAKVEYFQGTVKLDEDAVAPFSYNWNNVLAGSYQIRAVATDLAGLTATATVNITVNAVAGRPPAVLQSLKGLAVPEPAALSSFVTNRAAAIALGKALFWDVQVSSDNRTACASCHFQAGADVRSRGQSNPGMNRVGVGAFSFTRTRSGAAASGPDYRMNAADFPQYELSGPGDPNSAVVFSTTDVMGSQGVARATFSAPGTAPAPDVCAVSPDPAFGTFRQTTARNAPTVINAVFNLRNLYDGSANHFFNGVDKFGKRNTQAVIYRGASATPQAVALENSSLASQALSVPVNPQEMSCAGRTWPQIGRRLLSAVPLAAQAVSATDSALASYRATNGRGLRNTYADLVQAAFAADLWSATTNVTIAGQSYSQREANFALFFGLALQMYQSTLVSNDAPLDRFFANYPSTDVADFNALTPLEFQGMSLFTGKGACINCHSGPQLSNAGTPAHLALASGVVADRMFQGNGQKGIYDFGFYNIGVRPSADDLGVGGTDAFGNPLSFARQATSGVNRDGFTVTPCNLSEDPCTAVNPSERTVVNGAFKTATLRNVALTGPYFHDGSLATLEDVVQFYVRRGNARTVGDGDTTGFGGDSSNLAGSFPRIELSGTEQAALVQFLKTALTDDRVAYERAPFDHPELPLVEGSDTMIVPAVGAGGRATPLTPFSSSVASGSLGYPLNGPPTISLTTNGSTFNAPASVTLTASAADADGAVAKVEFFNGSTKLGESLTAPYTFAWSGVTAGNYSLTARATDHLGLLAVSGAVNIVVNPAANNPPVVSLSTNGTAFLAPASITLSASAADTDGTIAKVEFFSGSTKLGEDLSAPYSFSWTGVTTGTYSLTARATDNLGSGASSSTVVVTVTAPTNNPPSVSLSTNGNPFTAPASITLTATAADTDGTVAKVEFFNGAVKLGEDLTAPYSFAWNSVAAGSYSVTAVATDNAGASTASLPLSITVNGATGFCTFPSVGIIDNLNRANGALGGLWTGQTGGYTITNNQAVFTGGDAFVAQSTALGVDQEAYVRFTNIASGTSEADIILKAGDATWWREGALIVAYLPGSQSIQVWTYDPSATWVMRTSIATTLANGDVFGARVRGATGAVEVYRNGVQIGTASVAGWTRQNLGGLAGVWLVGPAGSSFDDFGSGNLNCSGQGSNVPPTVSLSTNGSVFNAPASITLTASAADSDGSVAKVEFFNGATKLGEDLSAPYSFSWTGVTAGTYSLTARATDNLGATTTSSLITVIVNAAANLPPTVSISTNGTTFTAPATITLSASAADSDGTVAKVEFYNGSTKLGEDLTAPYSFTWTNVTAGTYNLNARATDNLGTFANSSSVTVTVNAAANLPPSVSLTTNGTTFTAPASITLNATAADSDGSVSKIEFYSGSTKLGEDLTSPYTFSWTSVAAGTYSLTARATDNLGAVTTSGTITVTVNGTTGGCAFPSVGIADNFNRSNGAVGGSWSSWTSTTYSISNNQMVVGSGDQYFVWQQPVGPSVEASVKITSINAASQEIDLVLKSMTNNWYNGAVIISYNSGQLQVWSAVTGNWTQHNGLNVQLVAGDVLGGRLRSNGSVEVYRNGALIATTSVGSWPHLNSTGYAGVWVVNGSGTAFDDFRAGTLTCQ